MVEDVDRAGITDLFVQVRGRGDAYYDSDLVPNPRRLREAWARYGRYDPLRLILEEAHARGIRVHAWLNVYLVWGAGKPPPGHVVEAHPEWVAVDARGTPMSARSLSYLKRMQTEGTYLEPSDPLVVRHFSEVVGEVLTRYPVDGIHLDYVRYPELDVGYHPAMRASFHRRTGIDPTELSLDPARLGREGGRARLEELEQRWWSFKADQVTALVATVRRTILGIRPEVILSAAVKPDPHRARIANGQDWARWVEEGLVDVVVPMMYSTSRRTVERQATALTALVPSPRAWAGIAVYNQSLSDASAKIDAVREAGVAGISIFSYNSVPGGGRGLMRLDPGR
jgi:uncharacterized lipoprotein YddW (UPF0748 family)